MTKHLFYTENKLNPLFQQHMPQGRMQARDFAFFMKKYSFMQQATKQKLQAKKDNGGCQ